MTRSITGLNKTYKVMPVDICIVLNKTVRDGNFNVIVHNEDGTGYYLVKMSWAIENEFFYTVYL